MNMTNISVGTGGIVALLGYGVVFLGLIMLMVVVMIMSRIMIAKTAKDAAKASVPAAPAPAAAAASVSAPGTAGELKLYDTNPRDAAMVMAIVADTLGKPINELRFISIKEVKEDEI